jgi:hypothetical protein
VAARETKNVSLQVGNENLGNGMNVPVTTEPVFASQGGEILLYGTESDSRWPLLKPL